MQSDKPKGTLLINVGTQGGSVFAWEGTTKSELEVALEVIQEFVASKRPNLFTMSGERTAREITVQAIRTKATLNRDGEKQGRT